MPSTRAFGRWDRSHLHEFRLADDTLIGIPDDDAVEEALDDEETHLGRLSAGEQFLYAFDFGDDWHHLCTVGDTTLDPATFGWEPPTPMPYFGWGDLPDQHGRRWAEDDGDGPSRPTPGTTTCRRSGPGGARTRRPTED